MIELIITTCVIMTLIAAAIASYCYADAKRLREFIDKQEAVILAKTAELRDWQNKALVRAGNSPLGHETRQREPKPDTGITPTVVTRGQLEARAKAKQSAPEQPAPERDPLQDAKQINVHATGVSYQRVSRANRDEVLAKAAEIIDATK